MKLNNSYVIGTHVMWYEINMFEEHCRSIAQMLENIENKENVTVHFCFNFQQHYEKIDWEKAYKDLKFTDSISFKGDLYGIPQLQEAFERIWSNIIPYPTNVKIYWKGLQNEEFYNIADYRRQLNDEWCTQVDFVLWGETDSLWPKQTLEIVESIHEQVFESGGISKYVVSFADRKMWDKSWDIMCHPWFKDVEFQDTEEWALTNDASGKSYMSLEKMNIINNINLSDVEVITFHQPKFDGSCLVISSDLIKSGINIPRALLLAGEDTAFSEMCKLILGKNYRQYHVQNILHVHNRRHPKKRMYVLNEDNPNGFCDLRKGKWWEELTKKSKENLVNLTTQFKFNKR